MDLKCKDCGADFQLNEGEINFYKEKGLNQPVRCVPCRAKKKAEKQQNGYR